MKRQHRDTINLHRQPATRYNRSWDYFDIKFAEFIERIIMKRFPGYQPVFSAGVPGQRCGAAVQAATPGAGETVLFSDYNSLIDF